MGDCLFSAIPAPSFAGRWEELERYGFRLSWRCWDAGCRLCLFTRPRLGRDVRERPR